MHINVFLFFYYVCIKKLKGVMSLQSLAMEHKAQYSLIKKCFLAQGQKFLCTFSPGFKALKKQSLDDSFLEIINWRKKQLQ